jgi:hypothetical protein
MGGLASGPSLELASSRVDRSVIDPTLRLALIFRSLGDRPCEPLAGWRTTPWRIGQAFRSVGCPSDSGLRGSYRHGPQAHKAAGSDWPYRTIWYGLGGVSRKTACEAIGCYRHWSRRNATQSVPPQRPDDRTWRDPSSEVCYDGTPKPLEVDRCQMKSAVGESTTSRAHRLSLGIRVGRRRRGSYQESDRRAGNQRPSDAGAPRGAEAGLERVAQSVTRQVS